MLENKKCPYCGADNIGLDLKETNGLYVCCKCDKLVDTKIDMKEKSDTQITKAAD